VLIWRRKRRRRGLGEAAQRLLEELARDFGTSVPRLAVARGAAELREACGMAEVAGCYRFEERTIVLSESVLGSVETILHEFAHHLQLELHDGDWLAAFGFTRVPHCQRPHEARAKAFASWLAPLYERRFKRILEGSEGGAGRRELCEHVASVLAREVGGRAPKLLEEARRGARSGVDELFRLAGNVGFMLEAARRACGLDADGVGAVEMGLSRVAALAMVGDHAEAERELERVKGELSSALKGAREALAAPRVEGKRERAARIADRLAAPLIHRGRAEITFYCAGGWRVKLLAKPLDERQRTGVIVLDEGGGILVASNDLVAGIEGVLEYLERRRGCRVTFTLVA
jgi:hypothetical protein